MLPDAINLLAETPVLLEAPLLAFSQTVKNGALLLGIGSFAAGVLSLFAHKRRIDDVFNQPHTPREVGFETRKYRRRAIASSLIASTGIMLAGIYAVDEPRTVAIFISVILVMLVGITGLAFFDLFSVGLNEIARTDDSARDALVEEYNRQREKADQMKADQMKAENDSGPDA